MLKGLFVMRTQAYSTIYGPSELDEIGQLVDIYAPQQTAASVQEDPSVLAEADVIFSGWGMAKMDDAFLAAAPRLKAVFYGAGSIRGFATDAGWDRGILVTSAYAANAIPTAEYALSQILFSLKRGWFYALAVKRDGRYPKREPVPGAYQSEVGLVSLGMIGSRVARLLQPFDVRVLAYTSSEEKAASLGAERCSLEEVFARSDVVSMHTPWLKETEGMITGEHFAAMKPNATFINTARGAVVREGEMIEVLRERTDLFAVLDVTYPEPPEPGSPLYTLPNVVLTPHIAGSLSGECRRMGGYVVEELKRYLCGEPQLWPISREQAATLA
ncbi:MAG: hydroxyacid dehydrogenase [Anaerolineae bacterium]|nr:hydroxyacid dehydrogenase [Anaerolineae bacterium]